jgi:hypothetical protein
MSAHQRVHLGHRLESGLDGSFAIGGDLDESAEERAAAAKHF